MDTIQQQAYTAFQKGKSIAILGPAGSGKSHVIRIIQEYCDAHDWNVQICAMTGCAAVLLDCGASTLHAWSGIGLGDKPADQLLEDIRRWKNMVMRWKKVKVLIVDEISMLTADILEKLDYIARAIRGNNRFMGGIQVVLSGDFYQLPPINKTGETKFCFESELWKPENLEEVHFKSIYRQSDPVWQTILNEIRVGQCSKDSEDKLNQRCIEPSDDSLIRPTKLFCRRADVDAINIRELTTLDGREQTWTPSLIVRSNSITIPTIPTVHKATVDRLVQSFDKQAQYESVLRLKIGAQVMLLINMDTEAGLVNGSRGVVVAMEGSPIVQFMNGMVVNIENHEWEIGRLDDRTKVYRKHIPLKLAYAITVHKAQGMTLDCVQLDIGESVFECGQTYVALSRVRSMEGLFIQQFDPSKIKAHPKVLARGQ